MLNKILHFVGCIDSSTGKDVISFYKLGFVLLGGLFTILLIPLFYLLFYSLDFQHNKNIDSLDSFMKETVNEAAQIYLGRGLSKDLNIFLDGLIDNYPIDYLHVIDNDGVYFAQLGNSAVEGGDLIAVDLYDRQSPVDFLDFNSSQENEPVVIGSLGYILDKDKGNTFFSFSEYPVLFWLILMVIVIVFSMLFLVFKFLLSKLNKLSNAFEHLSNSEFDIIASNFGGRSIVFDINQRVLNVAEKMSLNKAAIDKQELILRSDLRRSASDLKSYINNYNLHNSIAISLLERVLYISNKLTDELNSAEAVIVELQNNILKISNGGNYNNTSLVDSAKLVMVALDDSKIISQSLHDEIIQSRSIYTSDFSLSARCVSFNIIRRLQDVSDTEFLNINGDPCTLNVSYTKHDNVLLTQGNIGFLHLFYHDLAEAIFSSGTLKQLVYNVETFNGACGNKSDEMLMQVSARIPSQNFSKDTIDNFLSINKMETDNYVERYRMKYFGLKQLSDMQSWDMNIRFNKFSELVFMVEMVYKITDQENEFVECVTDVSSIKHVLYVSDDSDLFYKLESLFKKRVFDGVSMIKSIDDALSSSSNLALIIIDEGYEFRSIPSELKDVKRIRMVSSNSSNYKKGMLKRNESDEWEEAILAQIQESNAV